MAPAPSISADGDNNGDNVEGSIQLVVGNTYKRIPESVAKLDRSRQHRKVHDWILYVDVLPGSDPDLIESVTFDMSHHASFSGGGGKAKFTCHCPVRVGGNRKQAGSANGRWRFSTRQQTYGISGSCRPDVIIRGRGGSVHRIARARLDFSSTGGGELTGYSTSDPHTFYEKRWYRPLKSIKMADHRFGVELELTSGSADTAEVIASSIKRRSKIDVRVLMDDYCAASRDHSHWKLMRDSSIACHVGRPDCNAFELVSPILRGGEGLNECYKVLEGVKNVSSIKINKSMGFHVHVCVEGMSHSSLVKLCQNFIKYEDVMDSIMPPSRRTENDYCRSNKSAVPGTTNRQRHDAIGSCADVTELARCMNPEGRYYKLNLQNLVQGRQHTVEFRQHSATNDPTKVKNWVRFCTALVLNSARLRPPTPLREGATVDDGFDALFQYAIKDRSLRNFYDGRRADHGREGGESAVAPCCDGCASGGACSSGPPRKRARA